MRHPRLPLVSLLPLSLLPLLLSTVAGCATTLVEQDIQRQSDAWTITFHKLTDGPSSFTSTDAVMYHPESDLHFLWVTISVRNDASSARQFNFDGCVLKLRESSYLPIYVGLNFGTQAEVTKTPELSAGEEITRKLAYGYPDGSLPARMVCAGNQIPLLRN